MSEVAGNHTAGSQGRQTCTTADCERPATWTAHIEDADPPAWHPYCTGCASVLRDSYEVREVGPPRQTFTFMECPDHGDDCSWGFCPICEKPSVERRYVSLDAVVRFLFDDGKSVAAAKVQAEFGASS